MSLNVWTDIVSDGRMIIVKDGIAKVFMTKSPHPRRNSCQRELEAIQKAIELYGNDILIHCDNHWAVRMAKAKGIKVKLVSGEENLADRHKFKSIPKREM